MRIDIDVRGEKQASRKILRMGRRAGDTRPVLTAVAHKLAEIEEERFDHEGPGWAPLAQSTVAQKAREGLNPGILDATGTLRQSLSSLGAADQLLIIHDGLLVFGTTVPYAGAHQRGTGHVPQRKVIDLQERDKRLVVKTIQRWLIEGIVV